MYTQSNLIGFPGLGIGPFEISPIAANIFGRDIAWYGIFISCAFLLGILYAFWRGRKEGISPDDMIDVALFSIPLAIIGARLYYVIFKLEHFHTFYDVIAIWEGGLAVYGGIIFGLATAFFVCRFKKISVLKVFDSTAPAIMMGQAIGRWGNFTNAEAYGGLTDLPWRMSIQAVNSNLTLLVHPTFLYESLWNIMGFVIINLMFKKKRFNGQMFLMYITWYGFGRMFIEGLRTDSLYLGPVRISQIFGGVCFVFGILCMILLFIRDKNRKLASEVYVSKFTVTQSIATDDNSEKDAENEQDDAFDSILDVFSNSKDKTAEADTQSEETSESVEPEKTDEPKE